jgi:hypothetical protein
VSATLRVDKLDVSPSRGIGVECEQQLDNGERYAFMLYGNGTYSVVSYPTDDDKWGLEISRGNAYDLLKHDQPNSVSGACINVTGAGGVTRAHVAMAINGTTVVDMMDTLYLNGFGWTPSVVAVSGSSQSYEAAFREFTMRDLGGPKPAL